jgi:hypothetical protein
MKTSGNRCAHDEPGLSPGAVDELAGLLHPRVSAVMRTDAERLAAAAGPGPVADAWQMLATALEEAHEIAVAEDLHRGR